MFAEVIALNKIALFDANEMRKKFVLHTFHMYGSRGILFKIYENREIQGRIKNRGKPKTKGGKWRERRATGTFFLFKISYMIRAYFYCLYKL